MIRPEVREQFPSFTAAFEGRVSHMYADVKNLITIGLGCLIDPVTIAMRLPFAHAHGAPASASEVGAEWTRLKEARIGDRPYYAQRRLLDLGLTLSEAAIDDLARGRLDADAAILAREFSAWELWPAPAQLATLSMAWAMGAGFPASWPAWRAAAMSADWAMCANTCRMREAGNPGIVPRNRANAALFTAAAGAVVVPDHFTDSDRSRLEFLLTVWLDGQAHGDGAWR